MHCLEETLRERTVIGADGQVLGVVGGLFVDTETWSVPAVQVKLKGEIADRLGASRSLLHTATVAVPARFIQSVGDTLVLSLGVEALHQALLAETEPAATLPAP